MPGPSDLVTREATACDAATVAAIYSGYVTTTAISFESEAVGTEEMVGRMAEVAERGYPWLVAEEGGRIVGYAYANRFRPRAAYLHTAEVTIYLEPSATGRGIGAALYADLLPRLRALKVHSAIATIALPNEASVALHESLGFRPAGRLNEVGYKFGRWIDVGFWQSTLG